MPQKKKKSEEIVWEPDFTRLFYVKDGEVFIGGVKQDPFTVEALKSEASLMKAGILPDLLGTAVANEAARYALEEARITESSDVRSAKLALAQALAAWNKQVWTTMKILSMM